MKKQWMISLAAFALLATNAFAADDAQKGEAQASENGPHKEWTLEDARAHAHAYAEKLDKMTPEQWAERQKKRHAWKDKWKAMTPEEKEAQKKKWREKRAEKAKGADAKPAGEKP